MVGQWLEVLLLCLERGTDPAVTPFHHGVNELLVGLRSAKFISAAQQQSLFELPLDVVVGRLDGTILVGHASGYYG